MAVDKSHSGVVLSHPEEALSQPYEALRVTVPCDDDWRAF